MDLHQRLDIALKLLETTDRMNLLRHGDIKMLDELACQIQVGPKDLEAFANEVVNRSQFQAEYQKERAQKRLLVTEDEFTPTPTMQKNAINFRELSDLRGQISLGYEVIYRIRSNRYAEIYSEVIGISVQATDEPLPVLDEDDMILSIYKEVAVGSERSLSCVLVKYMH